MKSWLSRLLVGALVALALASPVGATQKSVAALTAEISSLFADNTVGGITPAKLRQVTQDTVDSYFNTINGALTGLQTAAGLNAISGCSTWGDMLFRGTAGWVCLAPGTSGQLLKSGGAAADISWTTASGTGTVTSVACGSGLTCSTAPITATGTISITAPVSVANGGIGLTAGTSGGIPAYTATGTIASSAALTANAIVIGGGAGAVPATLGSIGSTTTILHGNASGAPSFGSLAYGDIGAGALSTAANFQANAASTLLGPNAVWSAAGTVALTDAATVAVDMSTGINFTLTLGGNRTLGAPSNTKVGQTGVIRVLQDGTGSRTLAYNAAYKFAAGNACALSTAAAKVDYIFYWTFSSSEILLNCVLDVR